MTFIGNVKKFKDYKKIDVEDYNNKNEDSDEVFDKSYNRNHSKIDNTIKAIIVGTYTPFKGRENGYFYSSPTNSMYEILDTYFGNSQFVKLKQELPKKPKDNAIINSIKDELYKNHIALLDVVDCAVSSKVSASDDSISCFNLDYDSFKSIPDDVVFICNSRNAESALKQIVKVNKLKNRIEYSPQILWKKKAVKQQIWNNVLKKCGV